MPTQNNKEHFSIRKRIQSFKYAFNGIRLLFREHNPRIHVAAAALAIILGFSFRISIIEWIIVILLIGLVLAAEAVNSAIERLADRISLEKDPLLGEAKDLAAGAVLFCAIAAAAIGAIIFIPKLIVAIY